METTARTLAVTFYHILNNPNVLKRLQEELSTVMSSSSALTPPLSALEKLPYLTSVINEGHRLAHGVAGRLARVAPDEELVVHGYKIPSGVTMSQSHYLLHRNEEVFPDPLKFRPERFLNEGIDGIRGTEALRSLVPFSRGARMCVGLNLAWAELYLSIAVILTSVKMELVGTTDYDVTIVQEHFIGLFPEDSKGIRVKVLGKA
jgi:cytochrome P450